jgi:hypothetical protein
MRIERCGRRQPWASGGCTTRVAARTAPPGAPPNLEVLTSPGAGVRDPGFFEGTVSGRLGDRITVINAASKVEEQFRLGADAKIASGTRISADGIAIGDAITASGRRAGADGLIIATVVDVNVTQVRGAVIERTRDGWRVQDPWGQVRTVVLDRARPPVDIANAPLGADLVLRNFDVGAGIFAMGVLRPDGTVRLTKLLTAAAALR